MSASDLSMAFVLASPEKEEEAAAEVREKKHNVVYKLDTQSETVQWARMRSFMYYVEQRVDADKLKRVLDKLGIRNGDELCSMLSTYNRHKSAVERNVLYYFKRNGYKLLHLHQIGLEKQHLKLLGLNLELLVCDYYENDWFDIATLSNLLAFSMSELHTDYGLTIEHVIETEMAATDISRLMRDANAFELLTKMGMTKELFLNALFITGEEWRILFRLDWNHMQKLLQIERKEVRKILMKRTRGRWTKEDLVFFHYSAKKCS
jgi:hypothetical protein